MTNNEPLYKYLDEKFATNFIEKGEILFRSLYYFQQFYGESYEDKERKDKDEGKINLYIPGESLPTAIQTLDGETIPIRHNSFETRQIVFNPLCFHIYCFSNSDNDRLYKSFKTDFRVKITDRKEFIKRLSNYTYEFSEELIADNVIYTNSIPYENSKNSNWIPPMFYKNKYYEYQKEFRCCIYIRTRPNENFQFKLTTKPSETEVRGLYSEILFKIGNLSDIAIIERKSP